MAPPEIAAEGSSPDELRHVLDQLPDGVVVMRDGTFAYANAAAARILGYDDPEELVGRHFASIVKPMELTESEERVRLMGGSAPPARRVRPMVRRDGSTVYAESFGFATTFEGAPATLVTAREITEERRLAEQMRKCERLASLGTLAAAVAHEINNPLTYILLNLQVTRRLLAKRAAAEETTSSELTDSLRLIEQTLEGADRVRVIVSDLRGFVREDELGTGAVDVREVMESILPLAEHQLHGRAAVIRDYAEAPEPWVRANGTLLGHVFLNLLINAAQAMTDDGGRVNHEVRIGITTEPGAGRGEVVVTVRDTGHGMTREVRERLFEPFFSTKAPGVGIGLGLALCLQRVRALGGDMTVESAPGAGATFTVRLPLAERPADEPPKHVSIAGIPRCRILVVDDQPQIAAALAEVLRDHDVEVAGTGGAALTRLRESEFDAVFCDLMLPDLKGTEVHASIGRERPHLAKRFVFMTADAFMPAARELLDRAGCPRLDKPFTETEVHELLALIVTKTR